MVFFELLNKGITAAPTESGMSCLDDNVMIRFVSDEALADRSPQGVSYAYPLSIVDVDQFPEGWPGQFVSQEAVESTAQQTLILCL